MICFHHNDADGYCAAAIVNHAYSRPDKGKRKEFVEMDYKKSVDVDLILPDEEVVIVDFSFKPEVMQKVIGKTKNIIWIDHHKTAADYDYGIELEGLRDFSEPGKSGALLAWEYFFQFDKVPVAVLLVSDYDTWQHKMNDDIQFNLGLMANEWARDPKSPEWDELLSSQSAVYADNCICDGYAIEKFRDSRCEDYCRMYGYETEIRGHKAFAVNLYTFGSHTFGKRMKEYDICIGYVFDGSRYTVSLYSDGGVDTSVISKSYGGGGHSGASGFICVQLPFRRSGVSCQGCG